VSDDEETIVRRRLRWLATAPVPAEAPVAAAEAPVVPTAPSVEAIEHPGATAPLPAPGSVRGPAVGRPTVVPPEDRWLPPEAPTAERPVPWPGEGRVGSGVRAARPAVPFPADDPLPGNGIGIGNGSALAGEPDADDERPRPSRLPDSGDEPPRPSRLPGPGAFDPGRRGVRALAAVAVAVVLGAGFWAWRSRPQPEPVRAEASTGPVAAEVSAGAGPSAAGPTSADELVVAVAGKVRRPGLVRVPAGARVGDAVQAAGGALPGVDVALLNPARKVTDGELILVGVAAPPGQPAAAPAAPGQPAGPGAPAGGGPVNLNTATLAQLDALPGVGPVLAQRILDHRDRNGGFRSVGDLRQVDGIGDARYEQLKELVTV
jgi:competence protein ComEA